MRLLLLIEDNPLLVAMYKAAFEKSGVEVLFAYNGEDGFQKAKKEKPNLIVLDILMPGEDGFEIARRLKGDEDTEDIKIIILTIIEEKSAREKAKKLGVIDYLIKSELEVKEIVQRILSHL